MKFLDAAIVVPGSWRQAARMLALPVALAATVAAAALWHGKPGLSALLGAGAFLGASLSAVGISLTRTPVAYCTALLVTAALLAAAVLVLLQRQTA